MKLYISFFIAGIASISALAISSEGSLNAKTSNKEIKAPEEEIQRDGNDKIKDELISIFHIVRSSALIDS